MRTTVAVDDEVLAAAKRRARERGVSLGRVVEDALRRALADDGSPDKPPPPHVPIFSRGTGPQPGVDLTSNRALYELLDENTPLDSRH